jgi:hypothetical protein
MAALSAPRTAAHSEVRGDIDSRVLANEGADAGPTSNVDVMRMRITIGATTLSATLCDNPTSRAFRAALPFTLNMTDMNANEKYGRLPNSLNRSRPSPPREPYGACSSPPHRCSASAATAVNHRDRCG